MYAADAPFPVYCQECWWSDAWDPLAYGQDYDDTKPFFEQFASLMQRVPRFPLFQKQCKNSDYTNVITQSTDCYLMFACIKSEECSYGKLVWECRNVLDALYCYKCERCYEITDCINCYNLKFSRDCVNCQDSAFLVDCTNCKNCFGSVGLRNKQYYIHNKPYSKEDYEKWMAGSPVADMKALMQYPRRFARLINSPNATGDHLLDCVNCKDSFDLKNSEDSRYIFTGNKLKDCYDCAYEGLPAELAYESVTSYSYNIRFSLNNFDNLNISYCIDCYNSENLFGCIGLSKAQYCILNKQYDKESFQTLCEQIVRRMDEQPYADAKGRIYRYGEFFPAPLSPFAYNESVAQEYFSLNKEEALEQGYRWKDSVKKSLEPKPHEIIACAHKGACNEQCTLAFRLIPSEVAFYKTMNLPLPLFCPNCRHYQRLAKRNPCKLWQRQCARCGKNVQSSYAPERKEIIYCEECYRKEVI